VSSIKALRIVLIALSISAVEQANLCAGSYTWNASGGDGLTLETFPQDSGPVFTPVPAPTSIPVTLLYDSGPSGQSITSGDTTTYFYPELGYVFRIVGMGSPDWRLFFTN